MIGVQVPVELHHPVEAIGLRRDAEVLDAAGRHEAVADEGRNLRLVDADAARLVEDFARRVAEQPVAHHRPAQAGAPQLAVERGRILALEFARRRVEAVVAEEAEERRTPVVAARPRDHVRDATLRAPELRLVAGGDHLELAHRVLRVADEGPAVQRVVVVDAVDEERDRGRALAEDRDLVEIAALGATRHRRGARHQAHEIDELAAVERQRVDRLLRHAVRDGRTRDVHDLALRRHLHDFLAAGDAEGEVDPSLYADAGVDVLPHLRAEALQVDADVVRPRRDERKAIHARCVAGGRQAGGRERAPAQRDRRAWQDRAARILDRADHGARDLGADR